MNFKNAKQTVDKLYQGLGWPTVFGRIRFLTAPYKKLAPLIPDKGFIIDLGCGYGLFSNLLALMSQTRQILGLELDDYKIKFANRALSNVSFQQADITKITTPPADCILLIHVLHHLNSYDDQVVLLRSCFEKLKIGGVLIICEVQKYPWWKYILSKLADHLLYPGDPIYYRFPKQILPLLNTLYSNIQSVPMHQGTPFSHITYVAKKEY